MKKTKKMLASHAGSEHSGGGALGLFRWEQDRRKPGVYGSGIGRWQ